MPLTAPIVASTVPGTTAAAAAVRSPCRTRHGADLEGTNPRSGSLIKTGAGTLALTNTAKIMLAGPSSREDVGGGRERCGVPGGSAVTVQSGATFDLGPYSNASAPANALGGLTLNGGTLRATGAPTATFSSTDYHDGRDDRFHQHAVHLDPRHYGRRYYDQCNPTPSTWIGGGTSRIQNDTAGPLTITAARAEH